MIAFVSRGGAKRAFFSGGAPRCCASQAPPPPHAAAGAIATKDDAEIATTYLATKYSVAMAADWTQRLADMRAPPDNVVEELCMFMGGRVLDNALAKCPDNPKAKTHLRDFLRVCCDYEEGVIDLAGMREFLLMSVALHNCARRVTMLWRSNLADTFENVHVFSLPSSTGGGVVRATVVFASSDVKKEFLGRQVDNPSTALAVLDANEQLSTLAMDERVLIAAGESGSGKTFTSMLLAAARDREGSAAQLALYLLARSIGWKEVPTTAAASSSSSTEARNAMAVDLILTAVAAMTKALVADISDEAWPAAAASAFATGRRVVLIIDEAGECPTLVRAVCSGRKELREKVRRALKLPDEFPVTIIVAGTGTEGSSRQPGSLPDSHTVLTFESQVASKVWEGLCSNDVTVNRFAAMMKSGADRGDAACVNALDMVMNNARAAAIFASCVRCLPGVANHYLSSYTSYSTSSLVRFVTSYTGVTYKSMNATQTLASAAYAYEFSQAVAMTRQDATKATGDAVVGGADAAERITCRYGMVTDRARIVWAKDFAPETYDMVKQQNPAGCDNDDDRAAGSPEVALVLDKKYGGQRYKLSRAQIVMAHTQLGIGGRPTSGEGFEQVVADFAVSALLEAIATKNDQRSLLAPPAATMPGGWSHVSGLVSLFGSLGLAMAPVKVVQLREAMAPGETAWKAEVTPLFAAEPSLAASHLVVINGENAAHGDLLIIARHADAAKVSMVVAGCKRCVSSTTTLAADDVVVELVKMGFGDAADHRNAFVDRLPNKPAADTADQAAWMDLVKAHVKLEAPALNCLEALLALLESTLYDTQWRTSLKALLASADDWPIPADRTVPEFWARQFAGPGGATPTLEQRAVMVCYGKRPEALPVHLRRKGLYLFVPCDDTGNADSAPLCLRAMYPLAMERQALGVVANVQIEVPSPASRQ